MVRFGGGGKGGANPSGDDGKRPGNQGLFCFYQHRPSLHIGILQLDGLRVRLVFCLQSVENGVIFDLPKEPSGRPRRSVAPLAAKNALSWAAALAPANSLACRA